MNNRVSPHRIRPKHRTLPQARDPVVLPLFAFPFPVGPFTASALRSGLLVHMFFIGLPISAAASLLSK